MWINRVIIILAVALLMGSGAAFAFKEVAPPKAQTETQIPSVTGQDNSGDKGKKAELDAPVSSIKPSKKKEGIELVIPGIGKLGTLPKLDFGLELLYGASEEQAEEEEFDTDGVTIKGSVKHKF